MDHELLRHIAACHNAVLPGDRLPVRIGPTPIGWTRPDLAKELARHEPITRVTADGVIIEPGLVGELPGLIKKLAHDGWFRWRDEAFDIRDDSGNILGQIDRGALPALGIEAQGAHCNGLVRRSDGLHLWVGRRAMDRPLDPGKLDHIAAGGIPAGLDPFETLIKEAGEEAGIPPDLARQAIPVGTLNYAMERTEGLRRDRLHCFDLMLPDDFRPEPRDNEIEGFELWAIETVLERVTKTDDFKFNVNLVLIDLFLRLGMVDPTLRNHIQGRGSALDPLKAEP